MTTNSDISNNISIVLPTYNECDNIIPLIEKLFIVFNYYNLEIIVVDDNSVDGTTQIIRNLCKKDRRVRLIHRLNRNGLSSAIKEGILSASGDIIAIMDSDGQHEPNAVLTGVEKLIKHRKDIIIGSRFLESSEIKGLSSRRQKGSDIANKFARFSLSKKYKHITDYMSGLIIMNRISCIKYIFDVDVNGFKFLYELLAISSGRLKISEIGIIFQPRYHGKSKLDLSVFWDFIISLLHSFCFRALPRRAISFGLVGSTGVIVQLIMTELLTNILQMKFINALPFAVVTAAISNYLINNSLTFRSKRLKGWKLFKGMIKFLIVASLPILANVGLATGLYNGLDVNTFWSQISGIVVVFIWNYVASSKFVWNSP